MRKLKLFLSLLMLISFSVGTVWAETCTLTSAQIKSGSGTSSYGDCSATDGCSKTWNAYAIKNQHSSATSDYHFWQIKKYASSTAYYVQVPEMDGNITSLKITVSNASKARDGGGNTATLYFSASNSTSSTGTGVASGTGASEVTINCSSLKLATGYITASGAVRIWDVEVTYASAGCDKKVTVSPGSPSNGTFELDKSDELDCCDALTVTVTNIHPATGYKFGSITQSGIASGVTIDQDAKTVTYAANSTGTSTINVTFEAIPQYTVTWNNNGVTSTSQVYEGEKPVFPATPAACDATSTTFIGWATAPWTGKLADLSEKTVYTSASAMPDVDAAVTYYAVFAKVEGSGAAVNETLWSENFSSFSSGDKMEGTMSTATGRVIYNSGSVTYSYTNGTSADTKIYDADNAGGASPELLVGKNNSTYKIAGIPVAGAKTATLTYHTNQSSNLTVTTSAEKVTVGNVSVDAVDTKLCTRTITFADGVASTFDLTFTMTTSSNSRLDDVVLKVATNNSTTSDYMTTCCTGHDITIANNIEHGTVTADLEEACAGATVTLTPNPDPHCQFVSWSVNSGAVTVTDNQFEMPDGDVTVSATFEEIKNAVTFATPTGGTLVVKHNDATVSTGDLIKEGETVKLVYAADAVNHYIGGTVSVKDASNADVDVAADSTFVMPGKAVTISASFTATYAINIVADGGNVALDYTKGGAEDGYAIEGTEIMATATADDAHEFTSLALSENVTEKDIEANVAMFTMPAEAVTITATFAVKTTPTIGVSTDIIEFAPVDYKGALAAQTFNVSGAALAAGKLSISCDNAAFTVSPAEIDVDGALAATEVTVTPKTTSCGTFDGTITISGGGAEAKEVLVSLTVNRLAHGLVWSSDAATVTIDGDDNVFPTLSNPHKLQIELSSEDDAIATFDEGHIVLVAPGTVKIYANTVDPNDTVALPAENAVFYTLTVQKTYTAKWYVNGEELTESTQNAVAGTDLEFPSNPTKLADDCAEMVFKGWAEAPIDGKQDDAPAYTEKTKMPEANVNFYAVFASEVPGAPVQKVDNIDNAFTGVSGTNYVAWTDKVGVSGAVYAGSSAGGNDAVQLRSNKSADGLVVTSTGAGKVTNVTVAWNTNTAATRTIDIYGKNTPYSAASDLYGENAGTLLGSINIDNATSLDVTGDYTYIGIRSNSGALYLDNIAVKWIVPGETTYTDYVTSCPSCTEVELNAVAVEHGSIALSSTLVKTCDPAKVTVTPDPATGYELTNVALSGVAGATYADGTISIPAEADGELTVTATFSIVDYTVTMAQTGGASSTISGNQNEKHYNDVITVTATAVDGYYFLGWVADVEVNFAEAKALETTFPMPNSNVTVTAKFAKIMTVSEAIVLIPNQGDTYDDAVVLGYISSEATSDKETTLTYNVRAVDANGFLTGSELQVFRGKGLNGADFSSVDDVEVGAKVLICGQLKNYYGTREFNSNNYLLSYDAGSYLGVDIYGDATETEYEVGDEFKFDGLNAKHAWSNGYAEAIASPIWAADPAIIAANTTSVSVTAKDDDNTSAPVEVDVTVLTHAVTFSAPDNGTLVVKNAGVAIKSGDAFVKGTTLIVEAEPASDIYELATLTANGADIKDAKEFTISEANVEVVATFALKSFASLEALAAAGLADGTEVIVSFSNVEITQLDGILGAVYTTVKDNEDRTVGIVASEYLDPSWIIGGFVSGTAIEGTWKVGATKPTLNTKNGWTGISYTKPEAPISWSAASATAYTIGKAYELPTLNNEKDLTVAYSSTDNTVASINAETGAITLVAAGTATIKATYTEDTYQGKVVEYTLNVYVPDYITIGGELTYDEYDNGDVFDFTGLTATLTYTDGESIDATDVATWTINEVGNKVVYPRNTPTVLASYAGKTGIEYNVPITFKKYAVTFEAPQHGTLTISDGVNELKSGDEVVKGTGLVVYATPALGYVLSSLTANGADIEEGGDAYTVGTEAVEIVASFAVATGIDNTGVDQKAVKTMENGVLIIRRGNKIYNGQGQLLK